MSKRSNLVASIIFGLASGHVTACGEFFGTSILENRELALTTLWDASFALEAPRLIPPPPSLPWKAVYDEDDEVVWSEFQASHLRDRLLNDSQAADFSRIAKEGGALSETTLPPSLVHYALGAHHFHSEQWSEAAQHFQRGTKGTATARNPWPVVAAYMVGRSYLQGAQYDKAVAAFNAVRTRVEKGEADPLSLGAISLSEAATAHQRAGQWVPAIRLQMEQAALEVPGAVVSLRWRIESLLRRKDALDGVLADPVARDSVILYALSYLPADDGFWTMRQEPTPPKENEARIPLPDDESEPAELTSELFMAAIERALQGVKPEEVRGADRLAALLYRQGKYDAAQPFADISQTPLSQWVSAKLALRRGDIDSARTLYANALAAFPTTEEWGVETRDYTYAARIPSCRIKAETAVLSLQHGDVVESLELFLRAGAVYWNDAAYLAERVLTIEELIGLAERLPALDIAPTTRAIEDQGPLEDLELIARRGELVDDPRTAMSNLLARRLMRAERYDEAILRFTQATTRKKAQRYRDLQTQVAEQTGTERAKTLFELATLARQEGIHVLAFESSPDWAIHRGRYARPSTLEKLNGHIFGEDEWKRWTPGDDDKWIVDPERQRVQQHADLSKPRFTYRLTAAEFANQAADALPKDSQAFAAVLCHATSWLLTREPDLAGVYYNRYRWEGKAQAWAGDFGKNCPAPKWR